MIILIINYKPSKIKALLSDSGIVRNKLKINSVITNAQAFLTVQQEWGCFSDYVWSFVNHHPIKNHWKKLASVPTSSPISDKLSHDLKKRGFKFVGSTICYAFMQAVGLVNDHMIDCFCYK